MKYRITVEEVVKYTFTVEADCEGEAETNGLQDHLDRTPAERDKTCIAVTERTTEAQELC